MFWAPWWMHPVPWPFLSHGTSSPPLFANLDTLTLGQLSLRLGVTSSSFWSHLVYLLSNRALSKGLGASLPKHCLTGPLPAVSASPFLWSTRLAPLSSIECLLTLHVLPLAPTPTTAETSHKGLPLPDGPQPSKNTTRRCSSPLSFIFLICLAGPPSPSSPQQTQ